VVEIRADQGTSLNVGNTGDRGFAFRPVDAFLKGHGGDSRNAKGLQGTKSMWGKSPGVGSFTGDRHRDGSDTIAAGDSLGFKHRVVIHEGLPGELQVEKRYQEYIRQSLGQRTGGQDASVVQLRLRSC